MTTFGKWKLKKEKEADWTRKTSKHQFILSLFSTALRKTQALRMAKNL